ncbi:TPA: hypothetical protein DEW47_00135 [Patescibacteria group bacterium]|nr:hypothetical protein [Patescibacteria group bacterium]
MDNVKLAQGNIFQRIRFIFRKYLNISFIKEPLKIILNLLVNILAKLKRFKFPLKYQWDWKLEMLLSLYEKDTTVLFRKIIKPDMIIVDIGAHIGYYSRIFSKLTKEGGVVYAFEPDHDNYKLLKLNTKNLKNIRIFNEALSDKTGSISFYKSNNTGYHSLVTQNSVKEVATVPTQTLDNFIQENRVAKIDLIKIDVEGGEPVVFDGCKNIFKQSSLIIVMEFTPDNFQKLGLSPFSFLNNLQKSYGFSLYEIVSNGKIKNIQIENLNIETIMRDKESINLFLKK